MAEGDLASMFRQRQTSEPQGEWGAVNLASRQQELNWDNSSSLSPQSPFDYMESMSGTGSFSQGKPLDSYNLAYSPLRPHPPPSLVNQVTIPPLDKSAEMLRGATGRKMDQAALNLQSLKQHRGEGLLDGVARGMREQEISHQRQHAAECFPQSQTTRAGSQTANWSNPVPDCEVDQLATELESEIMGTSSPGSGPADYNPAQSSGILNSQSHTSQSRTQAGNWILQQQLQGNHATETNRDFHTSHGLRRESSMEQQQSSATGLQLVHLLLACAEAVANEKIDLAQVILGRLRSLVVPRTHTMQRLAAVFVDALTARITKTADSGQYMGLQRDQNVACLDMLESFSVVYDFTPLVKFPHLTLNQVLIDAVEGEANVHVIDLNTYWRGMQWPALMQAFKMRPEGPPNLRITSVGTIKELEHTKEKLQDYARNLQVPFEFCSVIVKDLTDFNIKMLDIREWEVVVISSFSQLHQLLVLGNDRMHHFLCDLRKLNPRVLAISENDGDHNSPMFLHRFFECLRYYSAVFDAFDASIPPGSPALLKIEQLFTGQKIRNIIGCEGADRIERHETMACWGQRMEAAGFCAKPISVRAMSQAKLLLNLYYGQSLFTLNTQSNSMVLGWDNKGLIGVAAWQ